MKENNNERIECICWTVISTGNKRKKYECEEARKKSGKKCGKGLLKFNYTRKPPMLCKYGLE